MKNFIKSKFGTILVLIATVALAGIAIFTAFRLYKLRQEAIAPNAPTSKPAAAACTEQCPGSDGILRNCHPTESDGSSRDSVCNSGSVGRVERCGTTYDYCCDQSWKKIASICNSSTLGNTTKCGETDICCDGTSWTKTMTACQVSPEPTGEDIPNSCVLSFTISATASPTNTPTSTATATSTASSEASLPEAGTSLPSILGLGIGGILLIVSLLLAI